MANSGPLAPTGSNTQKLRSITSVWAWAIVGARAGTTRLALRAAAATTRRERLDSFTGSLLDYYSLARAAVRQPLPVSWDNHKGSSHRIRWLGCLFTRVFQQQGDRKSTRLNSSHVRI